MGYRGHFSIDGKVGWEDRWVHMGRAERVILIVALLNFVAVIAASMWLGGDALNGKFDDGRYFVGSHGRFREVSQTVHHLSFLHVFSLLVTHPLAMFVTWRGQRRAKRALNPEA